MLGVVLWSDAKDGKAVFWCEDQGDLAYYESSADPLIEVAAFDPGDMVQFDVTTDQRLRRASNPMLVIGQAYSGLPDTLRQSGECNARSDRGGKVIQFSAPNQSSTAQPVRAKRKA